MSPDPPPPAITHRRAALVLFCVLFAAQAGLVTLTPIVPDVAATFGVTTAQVGALRVASALAGGVTAIALWRLGGRAGVRALLLAGLGLLAAGSLLSAAAPSYAVLAAAQVLLGAGVGVLLSGGVAAAAEWAPASARAGVLALALAGQPAAWIVGMPAVGVVAEMDWRAAWLVLPLLASLIALAGVATMPPGQSSADATEPPPAELTDRAVVAWATSETLTYAAWGGTLVYAGALLRESYGISLTLTGFLLGATAVAFLPGTLLAQRWTGAHLRTVLVATALAAAVLVTLLGAFRPAVGATAALLAVLASVASVRNYAGAAYTLHVPPDRRAAMTSVRTAATQLGYLLGAGLGALALTAGGYAALGAAFGACFALGGAPHLLGRPARRRPYRAGGRAGSSTRRFVRARLGATES